MISLFPNAEYFLNDHGIHALDPTGQPGIERGTYSWNEATGAFSSTTLVNTDGEWGLSDGGPSQVLVVGNTLMAAGGDGFTAPRLTDPNSAIVGGWYLREGPDLTVIDFLPNGTYLLGGTGPSFLEFGNYAWNSTTGAFQFHVLDTTDPDQGLSSETISSIVVGGDHLVVSADDGVFTFTNVAAVPEPQTYALILAGIGLIGAIARRRRAAGIRIVTCCRPRRPVEAAGF